MTRQHLLDQGLFGRIFRGNTKLRTRLGRGIGHPDLPRQGAAHLGTDGCGNPAPAFQVTPGHIILLRSDEAKHVPFAPIFADQRCRQPQPTARLHFRRDAKHGGGQEVHFVVDNQSPGLLVEQPQMRKILARRPDDR